MSDRFSLQPNCSACGTDLDKDDEYGQILMMPVGEFDARMIVKNN